MGLTELIAIGELAVKIGLPAYRAYCEINKDNADAFTKEAIEKVIAEHKTTKEKLAEAGIDDEDFVELDERD